MSQSPSRHLSTLLLAALVSGLAACSLIVDFDPTGKPCDDEGGCLEGFVCNAENVCVRESDEPAPGTDGGIEEIKCGGRCTGDEVCLEHRNECVQPGCATIACGAGDVCVMEGGQPTCVTVKPEEPGAQCLHDSECPDDEFCLISSIPQPSGIRKGFCTSVCTVDADCTSTETARRACLEVNAEFKLCIRVAEGSLETSPRSTYLACRKDEHCADFPGRVCAVFDNRVGTSNTLKSPVSLCDVAFSEGLKPGESCAPSEGGKSSTGICIPGGSAEAGYASQRCVIDEDCFAGSTCRPSQFEPPPAPFEPTPTNFAVRRLDLCVTDSMRCGTCETDADCSPDAPKCAEMDTADGKAKFCTTECTVTTVGTSAFESGCPAGSAWSCRVSGSETRGVCVAPSCGRSQ